MLKFRLLGETSCRRFTPQHYKWASLDPQRQGQAGEEAIQVERLRSKGERHESPSGVERAVSSDRGGYGGSDAGLDHGPEELISSAATLTATRPCATIRVRIQTELKERIHGGEWTTNSTDTVRLTRGYKLNKAA